MPDHRLLALHVILQNTSKWRIQSLLKLGRICGGGESGGCKPFDQDKVQL